MSITPYYESPTGLGTLYQGDVVDVLRQLPDESVQCCVTSPPYWGLRDYQVEGQIGLEPTPEEYVAKMVEVFREVRRVLRDDGVLWLNLGDSYANDGKWGGSTGGKHAGSLHGNTGVGRMKACTGLKPKDLVGIPWRVAFALQADGWYLRSDIIWHKPNPMPESVTDRPTKAHEYVFLMSKSQKYFYDADSIKENSVYPDDNRKARQKPEDYKQMVSETGQIRAVINPKNAKTYPSRNRRSVWTIATQAFPESHFAVFPEALVRPCILAGSAAGDVVLDPFGGALTVAKVCEDHGRKWIAVELSEDYCGIGIKRIKTATAQLKLPFGVPA